MYCSYGHLFASETRFGSWGHSPSRTSGSVALKWIPRITRGEKRDRLLASKNGRKQKQLLDPENLRSTSLGTVT